MSRFYRRIILKKLYVKPGDQLVETITVINEQNTKIVCQQRLIAAVAYFLNMARIFAMMPPYFKGVRRNEARNTSTI